jgi:predicted nucleic acid-binding protein
MTVLLDTGPLGRVSNPKVTPINRQCHEWLMSMVRAGHVVLVPEIADYEVRRELLRLDKRPGLARLDEVKATLGYLPLTTPIMLRAAPLWAQARRWGVPTADPHGLDCDAILAAQALEVDATVATENAGHLGRFVDARHWRDIRVSEL